MVRGNLIAVRGRESGRVSSSCVDSLSGFVASLFASNVTDGILPKAVAALWEDQETEIEAVHLAIALAYHGLLRVPPRAETSELTPCMSMSLSLNCRDLKVLIFSVTTSFVATCFEHFHNNMALYETICQNGCQGGIAICLLCLLNRGPRRNWKGAGRECLGTCTAYNRP